MKNKTINFYSVSLSAVILSVVMLFSSCRQSATNSADFSLLPFKWERSGAISRPTEP